MVRWPGKIEAGSVTNEVVHHMDWFPTYLAAAGAPDIKERLKQGGVRAIGRSYKVHLDGYNILPLLTGETEESPRDEVFYFSDDGDLTALRKGDWKMIFMEQKARGNIAELTARLNEVATMSDDQRGMLSQAAQQYALQFDRSEVLAKLLSSPALSVVA